MPANCFRPRICANSPRLRCTHDASGTMLSATRLVLGQKYVPVRIVFAVLTLDVLLSFRFVFAVIFVVFYFKFSIQHAPTKCINLRSEYALPNNFEGPPLCVFGRQMPLCSPIDSQHGRVSATKLRARDCTSHQAERIPDNPMPTYSI